MPPPATPPEIREENYRFLQRHVYAATGIVLEEDKHDLFESRLQPIVSRLGLDSINDLCALLQHSYREEIGRQVVEAMATNETYFFRDPSQYDAIRSIFLPRLIKERAATRTMRFWSAAASTGQEAYSLAMLLIDSGLAPWDIQILGTDISHQVLERARSAKYLQVEVGRGLPSAFLARHFRPAGMDWQLHHAVRRMVTFERADLRQPRQSRDTFDLIFCRNVMIYFNAETKKKVFEELHRGLTRGGWLLLGAAETASGSEKWFERRIIANATVYLAR